MEFYEIDIASRAGRLGFNSQRDGILPWSFQIQRNLDVCFNSQRDGILPWSFQIQRNLDVCFNSQRDGILLSTQTAAAATAPFQFPTGWNSTNIDAAARQTRSEFQFPTGWNSTLWRTRMPYPKIVSIPNGMEFYKELKQLLLSRGKFQFPTGWNSTLALSQIFSWYAVSFNSQRDGILRSRRRKKWERVRFQFPTGWNSTELEKTKSELADGFNSQRDGILHKTQIEMRTIPEVSIPNGMEFYMILLIGGVDYMAFQFPTGWNSTRCRMSQSQCWLVSIPNGMEFYPRISSNRKRKRQFQFPTGWNSTPSTSLNCLGVVSFNSQRDGILRSCGWHRGS